MSVLRIWENGSMGRYFDPSTSVRSWGWQQTSVISVLAGQSRWITRACSPVSLAISVRDSASKISWGVTEKDTVDQPQPS